MPKIMDLPIGRDKGDPMRGRDDKLFKGNGNEEGKLVGVPTRFEVRALGGVDGRGTDGVVTTDVGAGGVVAWSTGVAAGVVACGGDLEISFDGVPLIASELVSSTEVISELCLN